MSKFNLFSYLRATLLASCVMELQHFPLDSQECHLKFGSCKYWLHHFVDHLKEQQCHDFFMHHWQQHIKDMS